MHFKLISQEENLKINGKKWYTEISFVFLVKSLCKMCCSGASSRWCPNWPKNFVVSIEVSHNGDPFVAYQFLKKVEKWLTLMFTNSYKLLEFSYKFLKRMLVLTNSLTFLRSPKNSYLFLQILRLAYKFLQFLSTSHNILQILIYSCDFCEFLQIS